MKCIICGDITIYVHSSDVKVLKETGFLEEQVNTDAGTKIFQIYLDDFVEHRLCCEQVGRGASQDITYFWS